MEHGFHWMDIVPTLFNSVLLLLILYFSLRKAFAATIATRSARIGTLVKEAESEYTQASSVEKEWQDKAAKAPQEIAQLYDDGKKSLERQKKLSAERAAKEAERIKQEAKLVAQGEISRAANVLRKEFAHKSVEMAGKYLSTHLGDEDRKGLVKNYTEIVDGAAG